MIRHKKLFSNILFILLFLFIPFVCIWNEKKQYKYYVSDSMRRFHDSIFNGKKVQGYDSKYCKMKFYHDNQIYWPYMYKNKTDPTVNVGFDDSVQKLSYDSFNLISKGKKYVFIIDSNYLLK